MPRSSQDVGNWPMNLIASPDGKFVISTDMGGRQALWAIQTADGKGDSHVEFSNKRGATNSNALPAGETATKADQTAAGTLKSNGLYYGLAFSKDRLLYAAQGAHDSVAVLSLTSDGQLKLLDQIPTHAKIFPPAWQSTIAVGCMLPTMPRAKAIQPSFPAAWQFTIRRANRN